MDTLIQSVSDVIHLDKYMTGHDKYQRFEAVDQVLNQDFYDKDKIITGQDKRMNSALKAYVDAIGDPYTIYMDPVSQSWFEDSLRGEADFEGIGAVVRKKEYYVLVEEVLKDSPAFKAGIKPLDRIISVDSGSVKDLDINEAVNKIKWPEWTEVHLLIERVARRDEKKRELLDITVTREKLLIPSVRSKILTWANNTKIGYIDIAIIGEETESLFQRELLLLKEQWVQWLILDLRWNGGGYLTVWVQIASHFIPKGEQIVSAKYRIRDPETYVSQGFADWEGKPVVVLIDEMTASAWEIIAMALQEQIGAKLIGTNSFGKGSIQTMKVFDDGASLKYTIGKWYSPSGKNIDKIGIKPDVEVKLDVDKYVDEDVDTQLEKAKTVLGQIVLSKNKNQP